MNRLKDKVAIITGATSVGIGRETALKLSSEGAFLTITGRNEEEGQKTSDMVINEGGKCIYIKHDVSSEENWKEVIQETINIYKSIDYLINNARLGKTNTKQYKTILDFYSKQPDKDTSLLNKISPAPVKEKQQFNPLQQAIAGNVPLFDSGIKITDKPSVDTPPLTALREKTGDFFRDFRATNPIMGVLGLDYPAISEISPTGETTAVKKFVKPAIQVKDTALFSGVLKSDQEMQKSFNKDLKLRSNSLI